MLQISYPVFVIPDALFILQRPVDLYLCNILQFFHGKNLLLLSKGDFTADFLTHAKNIQTVPSLDIIFPNMPFYCLAILSSFPTSSGSSRMCIFLWQFGHNATALYTSSAPPLAIQTT